MDSFVLIVSAREFSQLNANRLFNGNMCPIAFRSARGNFRVDCFGFGGCLSLPLPRSGEGVWSLWFDAHAGGLADVSLTQVPQPPGGGDLSDQAGVLRLILAR